MEIAPHIDLIYIKIYPIHKVNKEDLTAYCLYYKILNIKKANLNRLAFLFFTNKTNKPSSVSNDVKNIGSS